MKKKRPPAARLKISRLCRFAKSVCGAPTPEGVSLYVHVAGCLVQSGVEWPAGMSARNFVLENTDRIHGIAARVADKPVHPATLDSFLMSYEWRKVRMVVLKKHGARCQCCGASPKTGAVINVDHIKPRSLFPELALDVKNLQVLCHDCNHGKGNWDMTDWRQETVP